MQSRSTRPADSAATAQRDTLYRVRQTEGRPRAIIVAAAIFPVALAARLVYLHDIRGIGFFAHPVSDGLVYAEQAEGIAGGDWLGPASFVHAPLYAYVLGTIRLLGGDAVWAPRIVQVVGGAATCVLLFFLARRLLDQASAVVAALLLAVYPPALFFDGLIQKTSLVLLLCVLLLWLVVRATERPSWWRWLAGGIVLGMLVLTWQSALSLAPLLAAWLWFSSPTAFSGVPLRLSSGAKPVRVDALLKRSGTRGARRTRLTWVAAAALGFFIAILPWTWRNRVVTGEWTLTTPNLGQNFAMGNHPDATGTYLPFKRGRSTGEYEQREWVKAAEKALGRPLSAGDVSRYYLDAAWQWIKANPGAWLQLTIKKLGLTWSAYEAPDTEDYYLYQQWSPLLRGLDRVLHFGVLAPLAAAGLVLTLARWRSLWPLYGWLLITTLVVAAFVVFARYRYPLVPVLAIFAGMGIVSAVRLMRQHAARRLTAPVLVAAVAAVLANYPGDFERRPYSFSYTNHAVALADLGRYDDALRELRKALALSPDDVDAHFVMGSTLLDLHRFDDARVEYERARAGDPGYAGAYRGVGDALTGLGRSEEATEQYREAVRTDPDDHVSLNCLAAALARQNRIHEALPLFERVLRLAPEYPEGHLNRGNALLAAGRVDDAVTAYTKALHYRPDYADAWQNLGVAEAARRNLPQAAACFRHALELAPQRRDAQQSLVRALIALREFDEALALIQKTLAADPARDDLLELRRMVETARRNP